jgi:hypothetical protein
MNKTITIKNSDLIIYIEILNRLSSLKGRIFSNFVLKNRNNFQNALELFNSRTDFDETIEIINFRTAEKELLKKYCKLDNSNGNLLFDNRGQIIFLSESHKNNFFKEMESVKLEHKIAIEQLTKNKEIYELISNENIDVNIEMINFDDISDDINAQELESIQIFILTENS